MFTILCFPDRGAGQILHSVLHGHLEEISAVIAICSCIAYMHGSDLTLLTYVYMHGSDLALIWLC
jgi:hypothetical protein